MINGLKYNALLQENEQLKNDLWCTEGELSIADKENEQLKNEIIDLKTEIVDYRIKAYRLTKILNETSDYT